MKNRCYYHQRSYRCDVQFIALVIHFIQKNLEFLKQGIVRLHV